MNASGSSCTYNYIRGHVCMRMGVGTLGCMGFPDDGTGGRCGQCEFIQMNTLLSEVRLWAV